MIDLYQNMIADPFQLRGIGLLTQFRIWSGCVAASLLWLIVGYLSSEAINFSHVILFFVAGMHLIYAFWPDMISPPILPRSKRLDPECASGTINLIKIIPGGRLLRCLWLFFLICDVTVLFTGHRPFYVNVGEISWSVFSLFVNLSDACEPKPPRPKKVTISIGDYAPVGA